MSSTEPAQEAPRVGPVLSATPEGRAVLEAIRTSHDDVVVVDRGAYYRVLVASPCRVTREAIERAAGKAFNLPADLEAVMPAFQGMLTVTEVHVEWKWNS